MKSLRISRVLSALAVVAFLAMPKAASATPVGVELLLLVDVSGSVDAAEYNLQLQGYVSAFNSDLVKAAIAGTTDGVAVSLAVWSGVGQQAVEVGWTHLTDAASSALFASAINTAAASRAFTGGNTAPGSAINWGVPLFTNTFEGVRRVIDVSGDGAQNVGDSTAAARNAAASAGITINGLAILGEAGLEAFYANNIVTPDGQLFTAATFGDFSRAVETKIGTEIVGAAVPEPSTMALFGVGVALLGGRAWRRRKTNA